MADDPMIVHDAETCYTAYAEAFNHEDMATVVRYISAPYAMVIGANAPMFSATPEAVRKQFDGALAGMKARGWARSDFKIVHTWLLSKDHALLMSDIVGRLFREFAVTLSVAIIVSISALSFGL